MIFRIARYIIRAQIIPQSEGKFLIKVRADPLNEGGQAVDELATCDPCSYEEARASCYRLTAEVSKAIRLQGGQVADVVIMDPHGGG
jgi:hypothetical protein